MNDTEKRAEEIIEETMKDIFDDLNDSDAFGTCDSDADAKEIFSETDINSHTDSEESSAESADPDATEDIGEDMEEDIFDEDEYDDDEEEDEDEFEEEDDDDDELTDEEKAVRKKKRRKILGIVLGSILGVVVLVYLGFAVYFNSHFLFNTKINGTDFAMKSVNQVEEYMAAEVKNYVLTLQESDGGTESIKGSDISLEYVPGDELDELVKSQNNLLWITSLWDGPEIEASVGVKYNEDELSEQIESLACMDPENQTESVNAQPEFQTDQFVVAEEVIGTQIDTDVFGEKVRAAIDGFVDTLDLMEAECYILPEYTKESEEVIAATEKMNSYLGANVTYDFSPDTEVVDASVISQWVKVDKKMQVTFDEEAVKDYIASLAEKYNTKGTTRTFTSGSGNTVKVEGGSYGWKIDQDAEYKKLTENIKNAETVTREPEYSSRAASHGEQDFGNTYAEVDLTNQRMYYIKDGEVVLQSDVVTGNPNKGNATPQGVYSLAYKQTDKVLRGTKQADGTYEYETPVKYWMPFNGGIGFHDATWQSSFGGSRYQTNGSHGCVNMPYSKAAELYDLISAGIPVVCHF